MAETKPPFKQVEVEDFVNPATKAVFTMDTPEDLLVRLEVRGGLSVRMEAGAIMAVAMAMNWPAAGLPPMGGSQ